MLSAFNRLWKLSCFALLAGIIAIGLSGRLTGMLQLHPALSGQEPGHTENEIPVSGTQTEADIFPTGRQITTALRKTGAALPGLTRKICLPFFQNEFAADHLPVPRPGYYRFLFRYALF